MVEEVKDHLEKKMGELLLYMIIENKGETPFWRIVKKRNECFIICTIFYYPENNQIGLKCIRENHLPIVYNELCKKLKEGTKNLKLDLRDLFSG